MFISKVKRELCKNVFLPFITAAFFVFFYTTRAKKYRVTDILLLFICKYVCRLLGILQFHVVYILISLYMA